MKKLLSIFAIFIFTFLFAGKAEAADLTVACVGGSGSNPCTTSPGGEAALFDVSNWLPGDTVSRRISVINRDINDDCELYLDTENETDPNNLDSVIFTVIKEETDDVFGVRDGVDRAASDKNFGDIFNTGSIYLGKVAALTSKNFDWVATFDFDAGNDYQSKGLVFDFDLVFTCGIPPTPTPTPSPSGGGGGGGSACLVPAPGAPQSLTAVTGEIGEVSLSWLPPTGKVTHYSIFYGTNSGTYIYGNYNVGNVTSYTVSGLSSGVRYYFVVSAVNECAPGPYSNEASVLAGGAVRQMVIEGPAAEFGGVLGEEVEGKLDGGKAVEAEEGEVAGLAGEGRVCFWWLIFSLLALIINSIYVYGYREKMQPEKWRWLTLTAISVLAYFADQLMHRWWIPSKFCFYMLVFSLITFVAPLLLWYFKWREIEKE